MTGTWSQQIERRYCLQLPDDVRIWLDQQVWSQPGGAEFCYARTPEQLLEPEPGAIWAGFMLPDTLPLIGNDYGDWLCLRFGPDNRVSELVHWSHCGGDWIPYGQTLAEALLYDAAARCIFPKRPEFTTPDPPDVFRLARWARQQLPQQPGLIAPFWDAGGRPGADGRAILNLLSESGMAEYAVSRDRILFALDSELKASSDVQLAQEFGIPWEPDFVRWLFDTTLVPNTIQETLTRHLQVPAPRLLAQDWGTAQRVAAAVTKERSDLGWAFDIAGWAAERRGDVANAVRNYMIGLCASVFSDNAIRFRTHWFEERYGKFAAARLDALKHHLSRDQTDGVYLRLFWENELQSLRDRVKHYWIRKAEQARHRGEHLTAYQYYYRAGWDLGLNSVDAFDEILDCLHRAARDAGAQGLAAIAQLHRRFLS